jgi:hypothetical protein
VLGDAEQFVSQALRPAPCSRCLERTQARRAGSSPWGTLNDYGLGAGLPVVASAVGTGAKIASTILTAAAIAGPAAPIVAAVGALAAFVLSVFGGGCGSPCTDASQVEQIYENAADNLYAVGKAGMISGPEAVAGMQSFISTGQHHESLFGTKQANNGAANLTKVIQAEIAAAQSLPAARTQALNLTKAQSLYIGGAGWYGSSTAAAATLTNQYLSSLPPGGGPAPTAPTAAPGGGPAPTAPIAAPGAGPAMLSPVSTGGAQGATGRGVTLSSSSSPLPLLWLRGAGALLLVIEL